MKVQKIVNDLFDENTYLIFNDDSVIVVDPGSNYHEMKKAIDKKKVKNVYLYLTHAHYDHMVSVSALQDEYQAPLYIHEEELALAQEPRLNLSVNFDHEIVLDNISTFKDELAIPGFALKVYHVPGHTQGHSMLEVKDIKGLFTGDFLFKGDIGRTDLPTGNFPTMQNSLKILPKLGHSLVVYPGHYDNSTVGEELKSNPYLSDLK